jgi:hypothetical protein
MICTCILGASKLPPAAMASLMLLEASLMNLHTFRTMQHTRQQGTWYAAGCDVSNGVFE